jgi:hypothetical protein
MYLHPTLPTARSRLKGRLGQVTEFRYGILSLATCSFEFSSHSHCARFSFVRIVGALMS